MKKYLSILLVAALVATTAATFTGCGAGQVPSTKITFPGGYSAQFPKQTTATNLDLIINTNGTVHFHADYLEAVNEPNVIAAQGAADSARIKAVSDGAANIAGQVVEKAIKAKP